MFSETDRKALKKQSLIEQLIGMMNMDDPRIDLIVMDAGRSDCELCGDEVEGEYALTWTEQKGRDYYFGCWPVHFRCYNTLLYGKG